MKHFLAILALLSMILAGCASDRKFGFLGTSPITLNEESDLDELITLTSNYDVVLLGESSHGTQEFYEWRRLISQRLISEKGFSFIAVEGDWNSLYELNLYVKGLSDYNSAREVLDTFGRWPTWMWANKEIELLAEWLKEHNQGLPVDERVGFFGLDVYGAENSLSVVQEELGGVYPCLSRFQNDFGDYPAYLAQQGGSCEDEAINVFGKIKGNQSLREALGSKEFFYLEQNAFVVKNAEKHYRGMLSQSPDSWNKRVLHMNKSVGRLIEHADGKGIVWAHNTHVGDARATEMSLYGQVNKGQLLREAGLNVFILGFGTYKGEVVAGSSWGSPMQVMQVPEAMNESYEYLLESLGLESEIIVFNETTPQELFEARGHRAIGVVYNPLNEQGNYVGTILPYRYDAFIFFKETSALKLLN